MSIESYYVSGIVIQRQGTVTRSALNAKIAAFATHLTVAGRIRPLSGREQANSMRENVFSTHRLYTAVADILEGDRVVYGGVTYEINFVFDPMNFGQFLQIDMKVVQL